MQVSSAADSAPDVTEIPVPDAAVATAVWSMRTRPVQPITPALGSLPDALLHVTVMVDDPDKTAELYET
jgi:hypothetical protein